MNDINRWRQGKFIDGPKYRNWPDEKKREANKAEKLLVRPSPKGNAICKAVDPEMSKWIAQRLNLASDLEDLAYNFATGVKGSEEDLIKYVKDKLEAI